MSYTDDVMSNLSLNIKNLNNNIHTLKALQEEMANANTLKAIELGLQTGACSKEEAKVLLEQFIPKQSSSKSKGFSR